MKKEYQLQILELQNHKKMKRLIYLLPLLLLWSCSEKTNINIEGNIEGADGKMLYLQKLHAASAEKIDSVKLNKKGHFQFKILDTVPQFYLLSLKSGKFITLLTAPNEKVSVQSKADLMNENYTVKGSKGSALVKELIDRVNITNNKLQQLAVSIKKSKNDKKKTPQLLKAYADVIQKQREFSANFIIKNAPSLASYMALYQKLYDNTYTLNENGDIKFVRIVASSMRALYPKHEYTKAVLSNYEELQKRLSNLALSKVIASKGEDFPEIKLPDTNGKERKLSTLKGRFVILSFWASKDINSLKVNKTLRKLYKKYHRKGLEIYQVAADTDARHWKDMVKTEKLKWINVCDAQNGSSIAFGTFNVKQVPANYLIDQRGVIVGKNLFGRNLEEKVGEYIK